MPFVELPEHRLERVRDFLEACHGEREYYAALLDGQQQGRVFVDHADRPRMALFWHYAGFGFVGGTPDTDFLQNVLAMVKQEHPFFKADTRLKKRFILQQDDPSTERMFEMAPDLLRSERLCFAYHGPYCVVPPLPDGYRLEVIDETLLPRLSGDVTPAFSWQSDAEFLKNGTGCCILCGEQPAAWAFSAAIGAGRMDIGVETALPHRKKGLARIVATAMANRALDMGLVPVWGSDATNPASARTAESAGFVFYLRHAKFKKRVAAPTRENP